MWTRIIAVQEFQRLSSGHPVSSILLVLVEKSTHNYIYEYTGALRVFDLCLRYYFPLTYFIE